MTDIGPLGVILVKNGSKGDKLLFRYPYEFGNADHTAVVGKRQRNPYALPPREQQSRTSAPSNIDNGHLVGFPDKVLSNLFAVKTQLCGKKFELKVNDVRFVGHPVLLQSSAVSQPNIKRHPTTIVMFNIVFALSVNASHSVVDCYHNLSQRLGIAIRHEENRCGFLSKETKLMLSVHDEVTAQPEDRRESAFHLILPKSRLAQDLKQVYERLCITGIIHLFVNDWVEVGFCLPQKVHNVHNKDLIVEREALNTCLTSLKPYHAMLLLVEENELLDSLSHDASPSLTRLVHAASPLKSLQNLAADADLTLNHVFCLVGHLVYWAKATVIYPLCESNVYVLAPHADTHVGSALAEAFSERFSGASLLAVMSEYSLPISLSQKGNPMTPPHQQAQNVQMVVWMLQHRLLMQLHTYVYLVPTSGCSTLLVPAIRPSSLAINAFSENGPKSGKGMWDSDGGSATSDDGIPSPSSAAAHSQGSIVSDDLFPRRLLQDSLPADLSQAEKDSIMSIPAANNPDDLRLFSRLCQSFRGNRHLEEIMYYENVRRSQLLALLDKFRSVLITFQHEDAAVSMFYRRRNT